MSNSKRHNRNQITVARPLCSLETPYSPGGVSTGKNYQLTTASPVALKSWGSDTASLSKYPKRTAQTPRAQACPHHLKKKKKTTKARTKQARGWRGRLAAAKFIGTKSNPPPVPPSAELRADRGSSPSRRVTHHHRHPKG